MIRKFIIIVSITLLSQHCLAETCPSVKDIKSSLASGWKAFDSDDGTPLSFARETQFKNTIEQFALAEWKDMKNKSGSIHCYYRDRTGSNLEAYFAKENFVPKKIANSFWYEVSGFMHCAAGMDKCEFETKTLSNNNRNNNQLTKKQNNKSIT
jgi:hypothetical protein